MKKLFAVLAIFAMLFCVSPAMANGFWFDFGPDAEAHVGMLQLGAGGNAYLATPDFVVLANGTAGLQAMGMYTNTQGNGIAGACASQTQGSLAAQTLTNGSLTIKQVAAGFQTQRGHAFSSSYSGFGIQVGNGYVD